MLEIATTGSISSEFDTWYLLEMHVDKAYNSLDYGELLLLSDCAIPPEVQNINTLIWSATNNESNKQTFSGNVIEIIQHPRQDPKQHYYCYTFKVANILSDLQYKKRSRSWCQKTLKQILDDLLINAGGFAIPYDHTRCQSLSKYVDYTVQFNQTDFDFLSCLCHEHGIVFYTQTNDAGECSVYFIDTAMAYTFADKTLLFAADDNQSDHTYPQLLRNKVFSHQAHSTEFHGFDYNPLNLQADLHQQQTLPVNQMNLGPVETFPNKQTTFDPLQTKINQQLNHTLAKSYQVYAQTNDSSLVLGAIYPIDQLQAELYEVLKEEVLLVKITHHARQFSKAPQADLAAEVAKLYSHYDKHEPTDYYNDLVYIPWQQHLYIPAISQEQQAEIPSTLNGFVIGDDSDSVCTDEWGRVKVYMPWDDNNPNQNSDLCPWVRVVQRQSALQWLPKVGDEVIMSLQNGQINRPIIIGSVYNANNKPPFNIMEKPSLTGVKVAKDAYEPAHLFYSNNAENEEAIVIQSAGDLVKIVGNDLDKETCRYWREVTEQFMQMVKGDITIKATDKSIYLTASESIDLQVNGNQILLTEESIVVNGDNIQFNTLSGEQGNLVALGNNHKCPKRNKDATRHVGGPVISGSSNVLLAGKPAARMGDKAKCHGPTDTISDGNFCLYINGQPAAIVNSKTKHGGHISEGVANISAMQKLNLGLQFASTPKNKAIQLTFKLKANDQYDEFINHAQLNLAKKDTSNKGALTTIHSDVPTHQLTGDTVLQDVEGGDYSCHLSPQKRELAIYGVNGQAQYPYYRADLVVPNSANPDEHTIIDSRKFELDVLWPLMMLNCRQKGCGYEEAKAAGAQDEVDPLDIAYFQKNGNNVTIFIHGYNVEVGSLGDEFSHVEPVINLANGNTPVNAMDVIVKNMEQREYQKLSLQERFPLIKTNFKSSIWRDKKIVQNQVNFPLPDNYFTSKADENDKLNGTGAFDWAVNMERNLNVASGADLHKPAAYNKYERLFHVTWSGNWGNSNYGEAVDAAYDDEQTVKLAQAIYQFKQAGLTVNIMAHSLGNGFMLASLRQLQNLYPGTAVDHMVMWDAAVPSNVFNRPPAPHGVYDRWNYNDILPTFTKATVLYSNNDNILGPLPKPKNQKAPLEEVYAQKPMAEWVSAYMCQVFGLESLYMIAMALNIETSIILKPVTQEVVYQYLLKFRPDLVAFNDSEALDLDDFNAGKYMPTFAQQMEYVAQTDQYQSLQNMLKQALGKIQDDWNNKNSELHIYLNLNPSLKIYFEGFAKVIDNSSDKGNAEVAEEELYTTIQAAEYIIAEIYIMLSLTPETGVPMLGVDAYLARMYKKIDAFASSPAPMLYGKKFGNGYTNNRLQDDFRPLLITQLEKYHALGALYLVHMLQDKRLNAWHVPAMGYDPGKFAHKEGSNPKYSFIDQSRWLYQHSGMKMPSKELMDKVIKGRLMLHQKGIEQFGVY